jgi:hypothetical protein
MKTSSFVQISLLAATLLLSACGGGGSSSPPEPEPKPEVNHDAEVERRLRAAAEARLEKQDTLSSHHDTLAVFLSLGLIGALVGGVIVGSQARHEAETQNPYL